MCNKCKIKIDFEAKILWRNGFAVNMVFRNGNNGAAIYGIYLYINIPPSLAYLTHTHRPCDFLLFFLCTLEHEPWANTVKWLFVILIGLSMSMENEASNVCRLQSESCLRNCLQRYDLQQTKVENDGFVAFAKKISIYDLLVALVYLTDCTIFIYWKSLRVETAQPFCASVLEPIQYYS